MGQYTQQHSLTDYEQLNIWVLHDWARLQSYRLKTNAVKKVPKEVKYRKRATITRSWLEAALEY